MTGERVRFRSVILPPWCRKSPKMAEVLPLLYLHGLSTGDFVPALEAFFGSAAGLSAAVITRLVAQWQADHEAFSRRDLSDRDYVYVWADGVHFRMRHTQTASISIRACRSRMLPESSRPHFPSIEDRDSRFMCHGGGVKLGSGSSEPRHRYLVSCSPWLCSCFGLVGRGQRSWR